MNIDQHIVARALVETASAAAETDVAAACEAACALLRQHGVTDTHAFLRTVEKALQQHHKMRFASVSIPATISPERQESLRKAIEKAWNTSVHLTPVSDPSLLGGAVLRVGDELFDTSVKNEIDRIVRSLLAPLE